MRVILVALLVLVSSLAGCLSFLGDPDPEENGSESDGQTDSSTNTQDDVGDEDGSGATNESAEEGDPAENTPPEANMTATVLEGDAPLTTTFELTGSDADGDDLTWVLDLGDGNQTEGAELPYSHSHNYTTAGDFSVVFTVSDGIDETSVTLTLAVSAAQVLEPIQKESLSWEEQNPYWIGDVSFVLSMLGEDVAFPGALEGITYDTFVVDPETYGRDFIIIYGCESEASVGIAFFDEDGEQILRNFGSNEGDPCEIEDTVPEGAVNAYVYSADGGDTAEYSA